ncbi:hypothetical protein AX15_007426 [Amanita polypyramis BW_CC]|nr:hypothetical protein AX15_007426 [Amanita polypyramis BW_CC]
MDKRASETTDMGLEASPTATLTPEQMVKASNGTHDVDTRIDISSKPEPNEADLGQIVQLDGGLAFKIIGRPRSDISAEKRDRADADQTIYIDFVDGDKRNPANYSKREKWIITSIGFAIAYVACSTVATYNMGIGTMIQDLNCSRELGVAGFSFFTYGFAIFPLVTASFSEEFGRKPLYIFSQIAFIAFYAMIGFAKNISTVIVGRLLQGAAGSAGSTMIGGTIADIWSPRERGIPMAIFTLMAVGGSGLGAVIGAWIEMELGWRWIQWIQMAYAGAPLVLTFFMKETRSDVILVRLAKEVRKKTGDNRYRARVEDERGSLISLIKISCTRPLRLLLTEPVVVSFSFWMGFSWGVTFSFLSIITLVLQDVHHFTIGEAGTSFVSMIIGSLLGLAATFLQESLYRKNVARRGPEARLYVACVAGVALPVGLFIFAWTTLPGVHWIGLNIGIVIFMWSTYIIYSTVFSYLSDCYGTWASSASAGQSLLRNVMGASFPLFARQMFLNLSFKWAGTLLACIGVLLMPIPFVLFFWGPAIRKRSKVASKLVRT